MDLRTIFKVVIVLGLTLSRLSDLLAHGSHILALVGINCEPRRRQEVEAAPDEFKWTFVGDGGAKVGVEIGGSPT